MTEQNMPKMDCVGNITHMQQQQHQQRNAYKTTTNGENVQFVSIKWVMSLYRALLPLKVC